MARQTPAEHVMALRAVHAAAFLAGPLHLIHAGLAVACCVVYMAALQAAECLAYGEGGGGGGLSVLGSRGGGRLCWGGGGGGLGRLLGWRTLPHLLRSCALNKVLAVKLQLQHLDFMQMATCQRSTPSQLPLQPPCTCRVSHIASQPRTKPNPAAALKMAILELQHLRR